VARSERRGGAPAAERCERAGDCKQLAHLDPPIVDVRVSQKTPTPEDPSRPSRLSAWTGNADHLGDRFGRNAKFAIAAEHTAEGDFGLAEEAALRAFALFGNGAVGDHFPVRSECGA